MGDFDTLLGKIVTEIVNPLILLLAAVALVVFAWGVFEFVSRAGDEKGREEGRRAILWGLVGFVIIFGAYGIINLALKTFKITVTSPSKETATDIEGILKLK